MGWEHILSGLIAKAIVDRKYKKQEEKEYLSEQPFTQSSGQVKTSVQERLFVNARKKSIIANYIPVSPDIFYMDEPYLGDRFLYSFDDAQKAQLASYYSKLSFNPNLINARTELIHYLWREWREFFTTGCLPLLQNELLWIIDYFAPTTQEEHMYQHLALFISSECYFFQGDFANALKRLCQTLDWQEIYDNAEDKDGIDFNGLAKFHEAVIANIINIYALVGLPNKADEVRNACKLVIKEAQASYRSILKSYENDENMSAFLRDSSNILNAKNGFLGYYLFAGSWYSENFFKESCQTIIRGQAIYDIQTMILQPKDISYESQMGEYDGVWAKYDSLCFQGNGSVINYKKAIERCREDIMHI